MAEFASATVQRVQEALRALGLGHEIVDLSFEQLSEFAGNMLELRSVRGEPLIAMSQRALDSLSPQQRATLGRSGKLIAAAIPTIETLGGGSVRCMLAEVHLPKKPL